MSDTTDLKAAIRAQLVNVQDNNGSPAIAWENINFEPQGNNEWLRVRFDFTQRRPAGIGVGVDLLYEGVVFIDCFSKSDIGPRTADLLADSVMEQFTYGTTLTENSLNVKIRFAERSGARYDKPWYFVPVTIQFYSYFT